MGLADRRYRRIRDLTPFELRPLIGTDASAEQLRVAADSLARGFALESLEDGRWRAVGWAGSEEQAQTWTASDEEVSDGR